METLKPLLEVNHPDGRNNLFVIIEKNGNTKPLTLDIMHENIASISLNDSVPQEIISHFAQAKNLALYSWFHYQFHVTADFMSMVTIEYALKIRLNNSSSFKNLIKIAEAEGLISDKYFSNAKANHNDNGYSKSLIDILPDMRNDYAHGSTTLHNDSLTPLKIAAEFINQLFPESKK